MGKILNKILEDPVVDRERIRQDPTTGRWVEDNGGIFSRLTSVISNPAVIGAGTAMMNDGVDAGDMIKAAIAAAAIYKMVQTYQLQAERKQEKAIQQQQAQELRQQKKEMIDAIKNPRGLGSVEGSYGLADVSTNLAQKIPAASTEAFKNLSEEDKTAYAQFANAEAQHKANYVQAFAKHGCSMTECTFYDFDGNKIEPFTQIPENANNDQRVALMGKNVVMTDAMVYAMDHGYVTCKLPNGQTFDPCDDKKIANDAYSRDLNQMDADRVRFSGVRAEIDNEINDKLASMTDLERAEFIPKSVSSMDRKGFVDETAFQAAINKMQSDYNEYAVKEGEMRPYDIYLENIGARIPSNEEVVERSKVLEQQKAEARKEQRAESVKKAGEKVAEGVKRAPIIGKMVSFGEELAQKASDYQEYGIK